ncbi:MAG: di-trans,poly-cis-decaprenylcistransferase [Candidatus Aenigmarchaeota archaeon]|nr:di-trans,poly-cis-decaprenylcistransferase [Candidatus Aenigmarchaeota archaeon]NIP40071.1 di-trans,poly-cis-decaprenylcistransferase [Candidatus Aenigmarchaeota archaeon]NIQ18148.1 di-trans,poly-cis-decaprenylcistransferase [Candidatus Aenigmarchaeota archaeon]NIS72905.1 di-trans,poly-cis-decaprenylcistransferase [Candidatus Aenigmarchaeota archaeon]
MTDDFIKDDGFIHIALIPDGNRRYAEKLGKPLWYGHYAGAKKIEEFLDWCLEYDQIKTVSVFALSTENLNRNKEELEHLWKIYKENLLRTLSSEKIRKREIKVNVFGTENVWRSDVRQAARDSMKLTAQYSRKVFNILLSYGSKFEIVNAVKKIAEKGIKKTKVVEGLLDKYLWVSQPVDLIIRTGNQQRLSNFMLYQSAYAEIYFSKTMWPDFTRKEFDKIIKWYFRQQRKFGK